MRLLLWVLAVWVFALAVLYLLTTDNPVIDLIDPQPNLEALPWTLG